MKIGDLLPASEQLTRLKDIETTLLRRRTVGTAAAMLALASAVLQVVQASREQAYLARIGRFVRALAAGDLDRLRQTQLDPEQAWGLAVIVIGVGSYLALRWTGVLLRESKEPFRYTFWIQPFTWVEGTPGARCEVRERDRFELLHHDLTERLHQRIRRFAVLKQPEKPAAEAEPDQDNLPRRSSHVDITGYIALREERKGRWVLQISPLIRVGPDGNPLTLAPPVSYPLTRCLPAAAPPPQPASVAVAYELSADEYNQIVERVYSRIATEVYAQIETDVRRKISLFPTPHLRAMALYHEAEDFARSNTVDAYERAITLYRDALRYFELMRMESLTRWLLHFPLLWRFEVRYHHRWARVVIGYSKCLVYKRIMATLVGRQPSPLFELPELLRPVLASCEILHRKISRVRHVSRLAFARAALEYPRDTWLRLALGRAPGSLFEAQKRVLFELHLVDALATHFMASFRRASEALQRAEAVAPDRLERDPLYLVTLGLLTDVMYRRRPHLQQAVDFAPDFQLARWLLAQAYETEFRRRDEITAARVRAVVDEYSEVLKLNYGNLAALMSQGYLLWLIDDPAAEERLREGREVKAIARETFIGEINYRLARVAAEKGNYDDCYGYYMEALAADPAVAAYAPVGNRTSKHDYSDPGPQMLRRFERYKDSVEAGVEAARSQAESPPKWSERTLRVVQAFVLNDYANACLTYFHYHGDHEPLERAIAAYEQAIAVNPDDALPWYNAQNAYGWNFEFGKAADYLTRASRLAPAWSVVTPMASREAAAKYSQQIDEAKRGLQEAKDEIARLQKEVLQLDQQIGEASELLNAELQGNQAASGPPRLSSPTEVFQLATRPSPAGTGEDVRARRSSLEERQKEIRKRLLPDAERWKTEREDALTKRTADLEEVMKKALDKTIQNSRFAALIEADEPVKNWVDRLRALSWQTLNDTDVETLISLAAILTIAVNRSDFLIAGVTLAAHLRTLLSENFQLLKTLTDSLPHVIRVCQEPDAPPRLRRALRGYQALQADCEASLKELFGRWIRSETRMFFPLYWYLSDDKQVQPAELERLRQDSFGGTEDLFDNLLGHVHFRLLRWSEAAEAYARSAARRPHEARYHYHRGKALAAVPDWGLARSAYQEAHRLSPDNAYYIKELAGTYNAFGDSYFAQGRYQDALDQYAHAARLSPRTAVYHSNLSLALVELAEKSDRQLLLPAIEALETARWLEQANEEYHTRSRQLLAHKTAADLYGRAVSFKDLMAVDPVRVEVALDLGKLIGSTDDILAQFAAMRERIRHRFGVKLPRMNLIDKQDLQNGQYRILLDDVPLVLGVTSVDKRLCLMSPAELERCGLKPEPTVDPAGETDAAWLSSDDWQRAVDAGLEVLDPLDYVLRHLERIVTGNLATFLGHQEVAGLLKASRSEKTLAIAADDQRLGILTEAFRGLVSEEVSIRALEELCEHYDKQPSDQSLEDVIEGMRRIEAVQRALPGNAGSYVLLPIGERLSQLLRSCVMTNGGLRFLAMEPETCLQAISTIRDAINGVRKPALVVSDRALRIHLRKLVELEFPDLPVLAEDELLAGAAPDQARTIELSGLP